MGPPELLIRPWVTVIFCGSLVNTQSSHAVSSCLSSLLPNTRDPSITTRLRFANKFFHLTSPMNNIRHLFPMFCLSSTISISIQPSVLVFCSFFKFPPLLFDCVYLLIVLYTAVYVFILYCATWSYDYYCCCYYYYNYYDTHAHTQTNARTHMRKH